MSRLILVLTLALLVSCTAPSPEVIPPVPTNTPAPAPSSTTAPTSTLAPTETAAVEPATPEPTATKPATPAMQVAYIGQDGNVWVLDVDSGEQRKLTEDAAPLLLNTEQDSPTITYANPQWSSDGNWLAFQRDVGTPISSGYQYEMGLWVYDLASGQARPVLENQHVAGFAWKPDSKLITYGVIINPNWFLNHAPELADGIWAVEVDTGNTYELVEPARGYPLVRPTWTADGRYLSFDEVQYMEGRGMFAYYDFQASEYIAWDTVIGTYSWSPNGAQVAFDEMAYTANGTERIWLSDNRGEDKHQISPDYEQSYAFMPVFSPSGAQVAYFENLGGLDSTQHTLFVTELVGGEARQLETFEQVDNLSWSPDGLRLTFSSGPYENRQVIEVILLDGTTRVLAQGNQPAWRPAIP